LSAFPNGVKVIRKDHDRIDAKRPFAACRPEGKPQCSANTFDLRSASVTVKDHVPPGMKLRQYRTIRRHP